MRKGGWSIIKILEQQLDYNGYRVLAVPVTQDEEILSGNATDWLGLQRNLANWFQCLSLVEEKIAALPAQSRIIIWGAGAHTELLYQTTTLFHTRRLCDFSIVDSDLVKHGKSWRGIPIQPPTVIKDVNWSSTILLISSYGSQESILKEAQKLNVPVKKIILLYDEMKFY